MEQCPCESGNPYATCCQPLHRGLPAASPEALMRSRYSAYALRIPEYIITTTHPLNPLYREDVAAWAEEVRRFGEETDFKSLEITKVQDGDSVAYVTFTAQLLQDGKDVTFTERSRFERVGKRWLYRSGEVS